MRTKALGFLFSIFLILFFISNAYACDYIITDCQNLTEQGKTYCLVNDIIDSDASTCMNILANNIVLDCQGHIIDGMDVLPTFGIYTNYDNITIRNCVVTDWYTGVRIDCKPTGEAPYSTTLTNIVANSNEWGMNICSTYGIFTNLTANYNDRNGIYFGYSEHDMINNITANYNRRYGIYVGGENSSVANGVANYNGDVGFYCDGCLYTSVVNITANFNWAGVLLNIYSKFNNLTNIIANSNSDGIYIYKSGSNVVSNSKFENNTECGLYLVYTEEPNIIYNNLFNNTDNVCFAGAGITSYWNTTRQAGKRIYSLGNEIGGNYWTNPEGNGYSDTCADVDKDGFCDDPYIIDENNIDYLPYSNKYQPAPQVEITGYMLFTKTLLGSGGIVLVFSLLTMVALGKVAEEDRIKLLIVGFICMLIFAIALTL